MKTFTHATFQTCSHFKFVRACGLARFARRLFPASVLLAAGLFGSNAGFAETITVTADGQPITPSGYAQPFAGANSLVKDGTGTFTINPAATYTGSTTINAGTLKVAVENGLVSTSGITVASGATLELAAGNATGLGTWTPSVTLNGGSLITSFNGHVNVGNLTMNGGSLSSGTYAASNYGNFLMSGSVTVTDDATITASKILIRDSGNGYADTTGKFIVSPGKTLTLNTQINFMDVNYTNPEIANRFTHWQISGGGTVLMLKDSIGNNDTKITVTGATLDVRANNAFQTSATAQHTMTLNAGGVLNASLDGGHFNTGMLVLNGGKITSIGPDGTTKLAGSAYGNILVAGKITVTDDSSIDCSKIYIRGTGFFGNKDIGQGHIEVTEGKTLTLNTIVNFYGAGDVPNEGGDLFIEGKGTVIVSSLGGCSGVDSNNNKLSVSEATLQYGDGGATGSWLLPMALTNGATFATNRSSMISSYGFTISASNATISNDGMCGITFNSLITAQDDAASAVDLTFTGSKGITVNGGMLAGAGTVQKTGTNMLILAGANDSFTGDTIISDGTIQAKSNASFGTGKIILDGGTLVNARTDGWLELSNPVEVKSDSSINTGSTTTVLKGNVTGSGTITKAASGSQLHFTGDNSAFSGKIVSKNNWISFKFNPNDGNKTNSTSALANYVIENGTEGSGFVLVPKTNTDVFQFGMIETTNTNAVVRAGADATNAGITALNLQVGGADKSGTFAGQITNYSSNNVTTVVNIEKVGTGTWTWANSNTGLAYGALSTGTLTISGGTFQLGDGGTAAVGHLQGFNYLDADPIPTSTMPIIVNAGGTLAFNRTDTGNLRLNQSVTFNGGTLLQKGSKAIVFNSKVLGSEMIIDAEEGGTGTIFFQKTEAIAATVDVAKVTINGGNVTAKGDFNASTVTSVNGGTFFIGTGSRSNTFNSSIQLNAGGTLVAGNSASVIGNLVMNGGRLGDSTKADMVINVTNAEFNGGTVSGKQAVNIENLDVKSGSTLVDQEVNTGRVFVKNLKGSGTLTLDGNGQNSQQLHFTGDASAFTGTVISNQNGFVGFFGSKSTSPNAKYQSTNSGNFIISSTAEDSGSYQLGELSGANGVFRASTSNAQALVNLEVGGANTDSTYGGVIMDQASGKISITKVGSGTWTLSGTNTYTGPTTVKDGKLVVAGSLASATTVTGGELNLTNTGVINSSVTIGNGAYLSGTGRITGSLYFGEGGVLLVDLLNPATYQALIEENDPLLIDGSISAEDAITLKLIVDQETLEKWNYEKEFDVLTALEGNPNFLLDLTEAAGFWDLKVENGIVHLATMINPNGVPEPAAWLLLLAGAGFLGILRRRNH